MSKGAPRPTNPRRRRIGLRFVAWTSTSLVLIGVLVAVLLFLGLRNLHLIAEWSLERLLPDVTVDIGRMELRNWTEINVTNLSLSSRETGDELMRLDGGRMVFSYRELFAGQLQEIELIAPRVTAAPELFGLMARKSTGDDSPREVPDGWAVSKLRVENARFILPASERLPVTLTAFFSLDWDKFDFGPDDAEKLREFVIDELTAQWAGDDEPSAEIDKIGIGFTLNGLFVDRRVESVRIASGALEIGEAGWEKLHSISLPDDAQPPDPDTPPIKPWTIGAIDWTDLEVTAKDLPAPLSNTSFVVSATLRETGDASTAVASEVRISNLRVESVEAQSPPALYLRDGVVRFTFAGLLDQRIDEIELQYPSVVLRDELQRIPARSGPPRGGRENPAAVTGLPDWEIGRVFTTYGEFVTDQRDAAGPLVTSRFAFDLNGIEASAGALERIQRIVVWDVQVWGSADEPRPILALDSAVVEFSLGKVLSANQIHRVSASGGRLRVGDALAGLVDSRIVASTADAAPPAAPDAAWSILNLDISGLRTRLDDARPDVSDIFLTINTELQNVPLGAATSELLDELHTLEFADVELRSPVNREIRILTLRSVFVRVTIGELLKNEIREVVILRPTIYLNQDLFLYMERATATQNDGDPVAAGRNWRIASLEAKFGRLVIGAGTGTDVGLPLGFETQVQNLSFDELSDLQINAALQIPRQDYTFESYQLELEAVKGDLRFSYPPEMGVQNLVQQLDIRSIRWRQYEAGTSWLAVTFDRLGINGQFGGSAYGGYLNGGFSFFFQNDSPWIGWISGTGVDTAMLTGVISPQNFQMTGPLDFEAQVDAFGKSIDRLIGRFSITEPGDMKITKLDDMLARIPDEWTAIRSSSTRIALETLRDYSYEVAGGDWWFVQSQGVLNLNLSGPTGTREFEIVLHDGDTSVGLWQDETWGKR